MRSSVLGLVLLSLSSSTPPLLALPIAESGDSSGVSPPADGLPVVKVGGEIRKQVPVANEEVKPAEAAQDVFSQIVWDSAPESPNFHPCGLDAMKVWPVQHPVFAEDYILPSKKTVSENREHHKKICAEYLSQRWEGPSNYRLWQNGFSQFGQDKFMWDTLFARKRNGIFMEVGAFDGETHSNSALLEYCFGWRGFLVEANPVAMDVIKQWRTDAVLYNVAASEDNHMCQFLAKQAQELSGIVGKSKAHFNPETDKMLDVPCIKIQEIFDRHQVTHMDYISIDTEGVELLVLQSIDFNKVKIDVISMEENQHFSALNEFLQSKGYRFLQRVGEDAFFAAEHFHPKAFEG